jgi:hypothetical protein
LRPPGSGVFPTTPVPTSNVVTPARALDALILDADERQMLTALRSLGRDGLIAGAADGARPARRAGPGRRREQGPHARDRRDLGPAVVNPERSWVGAGARAGAVAVVDARDAVDAVIRLTDSGVRAVVQQWLPGRREAVSLVRARDVMEAAERLVGVVGLEGYAEVEFRRDAAAGGLMEVNPRLSASPEIAIRAGVHFALLLHRWASGAPLTPTSGYRVGLRMRWLGGDLRRPPGGVRLHVARGPASRGDRRPRQPVALERRAGADGDRRGPPLIRASESSAYTTYCFRSTPFRSS